MWTYCQSSGKLYKDGNFVVMGYSGIDKGLNNPEEEGTENVGPIPKGIYNIGNPYTSEKGDYTMALTPVNGTDTLGRSGFLIHGDLKAKPGMHLASHGCIIVPLTNRIQISQSNDNELEVVI